MKLKSVLLIAAGIIIAAYPVVKDIYTEYMQNRILKEWEEERRVFEERMHDNDDACEVSGDAVNAYLNLDESFSGLNEAEYENTENNENEAGTGKSNRFVTLGIIKIDKINVNLPVMDGATPEILKIGAGKLKGTTDIGKIGNTAISAHRSHTYGRNFNRLDEVEEGDIVVISTLDADYAYEVFNILVVEPDDVSVLKKSETESILTLITCHPLYTATHRLIVQARLIDTVFHSSNPEG
ncbi:MAG: class D sortase [Clostridiaceae bacterium]|nr:class D sortase [Clostridiaceae bacterium]